MSKEKKKKQEEEKVNVILTHKLLNDEIAKKLLEKFNLPPITKHQNRKK